MPANLKVFSSLTILVWTFLDNLDSFAHSFDVGMYYIVTLDSEIVWITEVLGFLSEFYVWHMSLNI